MTRAQRLFVTVCAWTIAFALTYVGTDYGKVPRPIYDPLRRAWHIAGRASGLPMGYFGLWLYALVAGALVGGLTWFLTGRRKTEATSRTLSLLAAWTGTAWAIAAGYFVWNNWP